MVEVSVCLFLLVVYYRDKAIRLKGKIVALENESRVLRADNRVLKYDLKRIQENDKR